jgi:hypothetical protein
MTLHFRSIREAAVALTHRGALARPASFDPESRTVEAIVASNQPVRRRDVQGEFLEILSIEGADLESLRGASVLNSHRQDGLDNVLGAIDEAWREGNQIIARIQFSSRDEVAPIIEDVRAGILNSLSVGYEVAQWEEGTNNAGVRTMTAVKWSPREISFVAVGADSRARTRTARGSGRARSIRSLGTQAGIESEQIDSWIDSGASLDHVRAAVLDDMMTRSAAPIRTAASQSLADPEFFRRAAAEALYARTNPRHVPSGPARQYAGCSIADIAKECCRRAGVPLANMSAATAVTTALTVRSGSGLHSSADFPAVMLDVINKTLRPAYQAAPSGLKQLAKEKTAPDFRTQYRVQLDSLSFQLLQVPETGEFKYDTMADTKASYAIATYGRIFGISRQAMINDDLGAFTDIAARLGQAAASFEAQQLVNLLTANSGAGPTMDDGLPMFHASHGNLAATGAVISTTTLSAARLAMRRQKSPTGGVIDVTAAVLVVPPELETNAEQMLSTIQATKTADTNIFDVLRLVVEPRFTNTIAWYLVAEPASIDGIEYAYLSGFAGPQTESRAGFEIDGIQVKVRLDYGCGAIDHRGWYRSPGA